MSFALEREPSSSRPRRAGGSVLAQGYALVIAPWTERHESMDRRFGSFDERCLRGYNQELLLPRRLKVEVDGALLADLQFHILRFNLGERCLREHANYSQVHRGENRSACKTG